MDVNMKIGDYMLKVKYFCYNFEKIVIMFDNC